MGNARSNTSALSTNNTNININTNITPPVAKDVNEVPSPPLQTLYLNVCGPPQSGKTSLLQRMQTGSMPTAVKPTTHYHNDPVEFEDCNRYPNCRFVAKDFAVLTHLDQVYPNAPIVFVVGATGSTHDRDIICLQLDSIFDRAQYKDSWCNVLFVVNKCDMFTAHNGKHATRQFMECLEETRQEWAVKRGIALDWDYLVVQCSAKNGEGLDLIKEWVYETATKAVEKGPQYLTTITRASEKSKLKTNKIIK